MVVASKPKRILPKVGVSESFLAQLVVSKLADRQPLYHLEKKLQSRYGLCLSRQCMSKWFIDLHEPLMPLYNLMKERLVDYDVASLDATVLQVLNEPERPPTRKSYLYCFLGGDDAHRVILYAYNEKAHKPFVRDWFEGFSGSLHADADPSFGLLAEAPGNKMAYCHAHARRRFEMICQETPKKPGLAMEAMHLYQKLYRIEREAKLAVLPADERYHLRQKHSKPLMDEFKLWLDEHYPVDGPKFPIAKAIRYCLKHWEGLCHFLEDGRLEIDNNHTEREIKPLVMARKNFLFCHSQAGAHALCLHLSLIRTAKCHGLDPFRYYETILTKVPHCSSVEDVDALLHWNQPTAKPLIAKAA